MTSAVAVVAHDDDTHLFKISAKGAIETDAAPPNNSPTATVSAANWQAMAAYQHQFGALIDQKKRKNYLDLDARVSQDKFAGIFLRPEVTLAIGRYGIRSQTFEH